MCLRLPGPMLGVLAALLSVVAPPLAAASGPPPGDGHWVVRATFVDRDQVDRLAAETEPWEVHYDQRYLVVDVDRAGWQRLLDLGFVVEVDVVRTEEMLRPRVRLPGQGVDSIPGFPCYRTVEETFASAQAIVAAHPTLATWTDIGDSWEKLTPGGPPGYDIMVLKLTNSAIPGPKPKLLVNSTIHAREYTTAELVTRFGEYLVNQYGIDADATWMLDHQEIHLILQSNPDGRKHAEAGALWRKNTDSDDGCASSSLWGTDLNRNFSPPPPNQWNCCGGSSSNPCAETYHGPSPASEPETQAGRDYVLSIFPDYGDPGNGNPPPADAAGLFIDVHSFSELVLWPWGGTFNPAPNGTQLQTLGRKFAYFNSYRPEQSRYLYATDGTTIDFTYGTQGVAAYTFELGTDFFQDCPTFLNTILPTNMNALIYAARTTRAPYMLPAGPDALALVTSPPGNIPPDQPVTVSATLNDTHYNNSNGTEPVQNIVAGEVYRDDPPWVPGAVPFAMTPDDGTFNNPFEAASATLSTVGWTPGRHILFVRGRDAAGNWGPVSAVFVNSVVPVELLGFEVE